MPITRTPWIDDDGTGTTGTILNNAEKTALYNQIDAALVPLEASGIWLPVPFAAANFSALAPMVWTVGSAAVLQNVYARVGKILFWQFYVSWFSGANVLSGTPSTQLIMALPAGLVSRASDVAIVAYCQGVAGAPSTAGLTASANGSQISISKAAGGNFALSDVPGMITMLTIGVV